MNEVVDAYSHAHTMLDTLPVRTAAAMAPSYLTADALTTTASRLTAVSRVYVPIKLGDDRGWI